MNPLMRTLFQAVIGMDEPTSFRMMGVGELVYVKPERYKDLAIDGRDLHVKMDPEAIVYSVFDAKGERLAALTDQQAAIEASWAHELKPMLIQ